MWMRILKSLFHKLIIIFIMINSTILAGDWTSAKYAGSFMETGIGARPLGMGSAFVAVAGDVTAIYWNPAGLIEMNTFQFHGMHSERFAGVVNWDFAGIGIPLKNFAVGFGFFRLGIDGIPLTRLKDPTRGLGEIYIDENGNKIINDPYAYKIVNDNEMAFVFSFSRRRSESFSYGGNIKVIRKQVSDYGAWGLGFDFGLIWKPYRSMRYGLVLIDCTSTLLVWNGGRRERINPHIKTGIAYPLKLRMVDLLPVFDVNINFENSGEGAQLHLGKMGMNLQCGIEAIYSKRAALRIGLDRGRFTAGAGFRISVVGVDYGFSHHTDLGQSHRISITLYWDKKDILQF